MKKTSQQILFLVAFLSPLFVQAQTIGAMIGALSTLVLSVLPLAFGISVVAFFWGVAKYIFSAGSDKATEEGRRIILGGIIGIFVISAIWGIIRFLQAQFGFTQNTFSITRTLACRGTLPGAAGATFADVLCLFEGYIASLLPIVAGLMVIVFFWGVGRYIFSAGNQKSVESGRNIMVWGIIGLFVVFSIWGIVNFLAADLGFRTQGTFQLLPE